MNVKMKVHNIYISNMDTFGLIDIKYTHSHTATYIDMHRTVLLRHELLARLGRATAILT